MKTDTIVALATPIGRAGVAIIRLSGSRALEFLKAITLGDYSFVPRMATLCRVNAGNFFDDAICIYFASPNSFTSEEVVEIQCHGGSFVAQSIIKTLIGMGARQATAGEFSMRAFMNGKMSIDQAEGICDLINAESTSQAKSADMLMSGELNHRVGELQDNIKNMLAEIEAKLDFPEYEIEVSERDEMARRMAEVKVSYAKLAGSYSVGKKIGEGVMVALVGAPNVGKSSLLNAMTESNTAIVTDIPGTTRDIVQGEYEYEGVKYILYDTAGLRDSEDIVEKMGVERALQKLKEVDIVLSLVTPESPNLIDGGVVVNAKSDIHNYASGIKVSAKTGEGILELKEYIHRLAFDTDLKAGELYITNNRHYDAIIRAKQHLERAINNLYDLTYDVIATDLRESWKAVGEITGETAGQDIIDRIFQKFCIGK